MCAAATAFADQLTLAGSASLELHDNAPLVKEEESDLIRVAGIDIGYKRPEGSVTGDLGYSFERRDYLHDTESDQNSINGNTAVTWHVAPRRLDAVFFHQIAQELTDRTGPDVSSNQEERSILIGGFDGYLHFSPVDSVVVSPRFSDVHFEESTDSNSQRSSLGTTWNHEIGQLSTLSLTGNYDHVTFDDSSEDYDGQGLMLGYSTTLSRLGYRVGGGYNRIDRDEGKDFSGASYNMGFDYNGPGGFSSGATFISQLTDSSIGLSGHELSNNNFRSNDSNFDQPDTIEKSQFDLFADQKFSASSTVHAGIGYLKDDYKETLQDEEIAYGQLGYRYTINTFWGISAEARYERTKFLDDPANLRYNTTRGTVTLTYKPLRALDLNFTVGQEKRTANVSTSEYTDNFGILGMLYRFF
jgi:hypothetical protein